jgi:hypothetical protein
MAKTKRTQQGLDLTRRLAVYSAAVGAGLAGANRADAAIHSSTGLNVPFGSVADSHLLTMEGTSSELNFYGGIGSYGSRWLGVGSAITSGTAIFHAGTFNGNSLAGQLAPGDLVGSATHTPGGSWFGNLHSTSSNGGQGGAWDVDGERGYIGFSFPLADGAGSTVYGWAEVERVDGSNGILRGWGYEDSGDPIAIPGVVPEPGGLALLALGATGVAALRRRRSAA